MLVLLDNAENAQAKASDGVYVCVCVCYTILSHRLGIPSYVLLASSNLPRLHASEMTHIVSGGALDPAH